MGLLINADFNKKLDIKLYRFDPKIKDFKYHAEIFSEMFVQFPAESLNGESPSLSHRKRSTTTSIL